MKKVFVDTNYLVALINPRDQFYKSAREVQKELGNPHLFSTEMVMAEVLNFYAEAGNHLRSRAIKTVRRIFVDPEFVVLEITSELFLNGLDLYESRLDKGYSLTDCISMNVMRNQGIDPILTNDSHFTQEGFKILL